MLEFIDKFNKGRIKIMNKDNNRYIIINQNTNL